MDLSMKLNSFENAISLYFYYMSYIIDYAILTGSFSMHVHCDINYGLIFRVINIDAINKDF